MLTKVQTIVWMYQLTVNFFQASGALTKEQRIGGYLPSRARFVGEDIFKFKLQCKTNTFSVVCDDFTIVKEK